MDIDSHSPDTLLTMTQSGFGVQVLLEAVLNLDDLLKARHMA